MADPMSSGTSGQPSSTDRLKDGVKEGAEGIREQAKDAARGLREEASAAFEEVKTQGATVVGSAQERLGEIAEEKKQAGIRQAEGLARAIHRAADEIQDSAPWMARYVREAADSVDGMARSLRDRRPRELVSGLEGLARRQPMAFFGAAALAGFAIARFARSAPPGSNTARRGVGDEERHRGAPGWQAHEAGGTRPATMAAATLGGSASRPQGGPGTPFNASE